MNMIEVIQGITFTAAFSFFLFSVSDNKGTNYGSCVKLPLLLQSSMYLYCLVSVRLCPEESGTGHIRVYSIECGRSNVKGKGEIRVVRVKVLREKKISMQLWI